MSEIHQCLNCGRSEADFPLVNLSYAGKAQWICTQCLPILIHHPERLADKLAGAEDLSGVPEE